MKKRIIYILLLLIGVYLGMVCFTALWNFIADYHHYSYLEHEPERSAWISAGSFLLIILSFVGIIACALGIVWNVLQYLEEKDI